MSSRRAAQFDYENWSVVPHQHLSSSCLCLCQSRVVADAEGSDAGKRCRRMDCCLAGAYRIVYLLSIVRPKEPLSTGGALAIDAFVVGCLGSLPGMPPLLGAGLIYLMLLMLVICFPWRSPFLLPSVAGLLLTLAVQIAPAGALWSVLTPLEIGAVAFVAGYLLIMGPCHLSERPKARCHAAKPGLKVASLVAEHSRALHLLPNHHLTQRQGGKTSFCAFGRFVLRYV